MKKVFAVIIIVGLGLLGWRIVVKLGESQSQSGQRARGPAVVAVEIAEVQKSTIKEIGRFTGSLFPRSSFVVAPKVAGLLEQITVDVGDSVRPGQLIAKLEDAEFIQQVEQSRAELAVAKASVAECRSALDVAGRELDRMKVLRQKKMASESELDEVEARKTASEAKNNVALSEVTRREALLNAAEVRLSYTRITASWEEDDGARVVGERYVDQGEMLKPNSPIVSILDNNVMTAVIDVIERDYLKVRTGQAVVITTDGVPGREFTGEIVRIAPLLKELSRQARVEIEILNTDGLLKPGMFIRARIEFDKHENATVVPVSALARRDGLQGVFVADTEEMKVRFVPVVLGITEGEFAEVIEPALEGYVVTLGQHLLEDGGSIALPKTTTEETEIAKENGPGGQK